MELYVAFAGRWVLWMLRSVGQLGPTLGSFTVLVALAVFGRRLLAVPLRHLRFHCRPTLLPHRDPQGQRDVAVFIVRAAPPPVGLWSSPLAACTGASHSYCTAPSASVEQGHQATPAGAGATNAAVLFHDAADARRQPAFPPARAVAMPLHNHGDIGRMLSTAWARASVREEGGGAEELRKLDQGGGADAVSMKAAGNGGQEAVGAADNFSRSGYAIASTSSMPSTRSRSRVGVADLALPSYFASTPTLTRAAATAEGLMHEADVGAPELFLATGYARASTRPEALGKRAACVVELLLPSRSLPTTHDDPRAIGGRGRGRWRGLGAGGRKVSVTSMPRTPLLHAGLPSPRSVLTAVTSPPLTPLLTLSLFTPPPATWRVSWMEDQIGSSMAMALRLPSLVISQAQRQVRRGAAPVTNAATG